MFTDVEGSTALRTQLGDDDADRLFRQHDEIIRERIAVHQGYDQEAALGDGFLAVFLSTRRAIACAIDIERAFDRFNRDRSVSLRVRVGLNTGEVSINDGQLSGEAVHAAARVCAAGGGGDILVSDVTRQLAGTVPGVTFRDVGEVELKGFPSPWRLWQVVWVRETAAAPQQVFVGREQELTALRRHLAAALDGRGGLVLVGGEPGVGKTALVKQLIREAEQRGALALFGRCYESEGSIPYTPFVEMLEQALEIMPPDIVREDMGEDAAEVARMVPEIKRRFPDIGAPLDLPPEQQRRYFFNAVGSFVARGSARFPLLLVIDDIHWADEPTLLLTEHMAALMRNLRVLAVGTYRDVELDSARPLTASMDRMVRARQLERLPVRRLDRETMAVMIAALAGMAAPDVVVDAIFGETEGNPFFVEEVYRHLAEDGRLFEDGRFRTDIEVDELDVPESIRLVVGRRLDRLGDDARRVLAAGAVVGRAFPFRLLEEIAAIEADALVDVLDAADAARVIVAEEREGEVHYRFGHELVRQTLLSGLSVLRRQRMHLAVADAIERTDANARLDRPSEIAAHLVQAGSAADPVRTLEYLELSAQRAFATAAFEEALRAIEDAITTLGSDDTLRRARLEEQRGWALRALGRFGDCIEIWDRVIERYAAAGMSSEAAELCSEVGYQLGWLNRFEEAFAYYFRGLAVAGNEPTPVRARLLGLTGGFLCIGGDYQSGEDPLRTAEHVARTLGEDGTLGRVLWLRCMGEWVNSRSAEAVESGRLAIEHLRRANDLWSLVDALGWASFPLLTSSRAERVDEGGRCSAEALELGERLGHLSGLALAVRGVAVDAAIKGDVAALEAAGARDLYAMKAIQSPWVSQSHAILATALLLRGDLDAALDHARRAIELEPVSAFSGVGWSRALLARAWMGDEGACRQLIEEGTPLFPRPGERAPVGRQWMPQAAVQAWAVLGNRGELAALHPYAEAWVEQQTVNGFECAIPERLAGMTAGAAGRWDEAVEHFEVALGRVVALSARIEEPQVEHWYAEMLIARGRPEDRARARSLLEAADVHYEEMGIGPHRERARRVLAAQ
jgi:tetratricopeptide (TPR) repeat protein